MSIPYYSLKQHTLMLYVDKHILKSESTNISMHRDGGGEMWFGVGQGYHIMSLLNPEEGHPVKYFLEPVVVFLNYAEIDYNYRHVAMVGISGGWGVGWTTTLAAAIDYRIESSFPIAGSYPFFYEITLIWVIGMLLLTRIGVTGRKQYLNCIE